MNTEEINRLQQLIREGKLSLDPIEIDSELFSIGDEPVVSEDGLLDFERWLARRNRMANSLGLRACNALALAFGLDLYGGGATDETFIPSVDSQLSDELRTHSVPFATIEAHEKLNPGTVYNSILHGEVFKKRGKWYRSSRLGRALAKPQEIAKETLALGDFVTPNSITTSINQVN